MDREALAGHSPRGHRVGQGWANKHSSTWEPSRLQPMRLQSWTGSGRCSSLSCVRLFGTPWTIALQVPLSVEFSRQEQWSGLPFISSGDLPDPGMELRSPAPQADILPSEPQRNRGERLTLSLFTFTHHIIAQDSQSNPCGALVSTDKKGKQQQQPPHK